MSWLKIFFKNVLGFTNGLNGQFLIAHCLELHAIEPLIQFRRAKFVPLAEPGHARRYSDVMERYAERPAEKFTRELSYARKLAREYFEKCPKEKYQTEVES